MVVLFTSLRVPTEAWQVTRRHLNLTVEEMANLPGGELDCTSEEMNAKVLKVSTDIMVY